jgi:hypothetical protein
MSRCVRRARLCGKDPLTGRSFEHRKQWLENQILALAEVFAVAVHAYAVMSNHFHVVLEIEPSTPQDWDDDEVARRWLRLSPGWQSTPARERDARISALCNNPQRLELLRQRLGSLSWFMRHLKEPIARRANREDDCTGRFWEGRFRTQALLDDTAVLACMVYVDLNPLRAGTARTASQAHHTSARQRAKAATSPHHPLPPVATSIRSHLPSMSNEQYLRLVNWTASCLHTPRSRAATPEALKHLPLQPRQWLIQVPATESRYWRAIGLAETLLATAKRTGHRWLHGIGTARALGKLANST